MSGYRVILGSCLLTVSLAGTTFAQDRSVGLVMGAPLQVGILWQANDDVAVRPDISWSWSSSELGAASPGGEASFGSSISGGRLSAGFSVLFYLNDVDGLRSYVAPGYSVTRVTMTSESSLSVPSLGDDDLQNRSTQTSHQGSVVFGAQQAIGTRLRVFGEVGLAFSTSSAKSRLSGAETSGKGAGTTGGVGVVWLF
ncbi:MAG: hypothetical protein IT183_00380 [Acidobacteria bacterium]|nr:hypothetical protein [Acidobacteriota bacterium]